MSYDLIVIGAGPGGCDAALAAARAGLKVALVEKDMMGGTCLNRGCIPTKTLLHSAELFRAAQNAQRFGVCVRDAAYDLEKIYSRKDEIVQKLRDGQTSLLAANKVDLLRGTAFIPQKGVVRVSADGADTLYETDRILIATGAAAALPRVAGIDLDGVVTSDALLARTRDFDSIAVIGGGVIGMEFASFYSALGKTVTVIEFLPRILTAFDREIAQNLSLILKRRGADIRMGTTLKSIVADGDKLTCNCEKDGAASLVTADIVLAATGRKPYFAGLFGDELGIKTQSGIIVNADFESSVKGIYAVGDVVDGNIQLAHLASAQARYAVAKMTGTNPDISLTAVPACVYTSPEIAAVGVTEQDAKDRGREVKAVRHPMTGNARTLIDDAERGFIKLVFDAKSSVLIGASLMCERASDLIGQLALAVSHGLTAADICTPIHAHPTYYEGIAEAAALYLKR